MENSEITLADLMAIDGGGDLVINDDNQPGDKTTEAFEADLVIPTDDKKEEEKVEETKTEEIVDESKTEEKTEEKTVIEPVPTTYLDMSKKFLEDGKWHDVLIDIDGKEIKLSEATEIDQETFFQIYEAQEAAAKEEIEKNYVSITELDENRRKLINIIRNGGDLKEVFKDEKALVRPFEGWNLEDEKTQASILYWQLTENQKLSPDDAEELVKKAIENLSIDTKVTQIVKYYQERHDKNIELKEKEVIAEKQAEETAIKDYRKNLSSLYKTEGLTDSVSRRLVDAATKKDASGNLVIDGIYEDLIKDPQKAKDLIFFMLEPEAFLKSKGANIKKAEQLDLMAKVKIIRDGSGKSAPKKEEEETKTETPFDNVVLE